MFSNYVIAGLFVIIICLLTTVIVQFVSHKNNDSNVDESPFKNYEKHAACYSSPQLDNITIETDSSTKDDPNKEPEEMSDVSLIICNNIVFIYDDADKMSEHFSNYFHISRVTFP